VLTTVSKRRVEITLRFAFRLRFRLAPNCFCKTIDAFSGYLYPQPRNISRLPRGKLPSNEICNAVKIPLDFLDYWPAWPFENSIVKMRMINAPHNNRRLIRFDIAMCTHLNPSELWIVFNSMDPSHDQPVTGRVAGRYRPEARGAACASPSQ
jgi:hypothetical protein